MCGQFPKLREISEMEGGLSGADPEGTIPEVSGQKLQKAAQTDLNRGMNEAAQASPPALGNEEGDSEFKASQGERVRPYLKP